jgi:hypothetical protein
MNMYHPYLRGKQFELLAVRELAPQMADAGFTPIIEPVREPLGGLTKALEAVAEAGGQAVVVVNPGHGDHQEDGDGISLLLKQQFLQSDNITAGILLKPDMSLADAIACREAHADHHPTFVHAGFLFPGPFAEYLADDLGASKHVFFENRANLLYRRHFAGSTRILLKDGFDSRRNADYPEVEEFSELHVTFRDMGMDGFGDFLTVGDRFTEGGGPAYAVAIHLTFIDPTRDDVMYIYHFVSTDRNTPTDPAGKFAQALQKLINKLDGGHSHLFESTSIAEFRRLHEAGHFPGLGYVKKLSLKHHVETLVDYFG